MNISPASDPAALIPEAMRKLLVILAGIGLIVMTPFAINSFIQGRPLLGVVGFVIIIVFNINAWSIYRYGRHFPILIALGVVPSTLVFIAISFGNLGVIGALWCYPAVLAYYFMLPERGAWLANVLLLMTALPLAWFFVDHTIALRVIATLTMVSLFAAVSINIIGKQQKRLQLLAITDPLTGVLNRASLHQTLETAIRQSERSSASMTIAAIDLDDFKSINDELGHDAGDLVLQSVGALLQKRCRVVDKIFRLGGEEFLVFLYNTGVESGRHVAEELRHTIESQQVLPQRAITASIGVATLEPGESWRNWMKRADANLYAAKNGGRNCVVA